MPPSLGKAQIRRLGERLCSERPTADDLDRLAQLQDEYLAALEAVDMLLRERLGLASGRLFDGVELTLSNRLKRDRRIIEKLWRGTELDRMQDIVGFRIVGAFTLGQQDDLTDLVLKEFGGTAKDRRAEPSHGYRAVHVVFNTDGFLVEVQVRTMFQDAWAQVMERYSERWGRQIQYGGLPDATDVPGVLERRTRAVEALKAVAAAMAAEEEVADDLRRTTRRMEEIESQPRGERDPAELESLRDRELETEKLENERIDELRHAIDRFGELARDRMES